MKIYKVTYKYSGRITVMVKASSAGGARRIALAERAKLIGSFEEPAGVNELNLTDIVVKEVKP